jgi:mannosyltransferase OCH1-like enzyme
MIPKIIWQTYETKYEDLSEDVKLLTNSWKENNPEWEYRYMSSIDRDTFVLENYGQEWFDLFKKFPINVMRADVWRYMVINKYGGVYADIDTLCKKPMSYWIKDDYDMIICNDTEDTPKYSQFLFASNKDNPILFDLIKTIKEKEIDFTSFQTSMVGETTGYLIWDKAIKRNKEKVKIYRYLGKDSLKINKEYIHHFHSGHNKLNGIVQWRKEEDE